MLIRLIVIVAVVMTGGPLSMAQHSERQSAVVLDENQWITFYDLPSRRFRAIRTAVLTRNNAAAVRDLAVTANYLAVEAERASAVLQGPLREIVDRLRRIEPSLDQVTLDDLDTLFGRAHWLLAQHYLELAGGARDARHARNASLYLTATTHHIERAMLWSNAVISDDVHDTLEDLREAASELQNPDLAARVFRQRPIARAGQLLRDIGEQIDRRVLLLAPGGSTGEQRSEQP